MKTQLVVSMYGELVAPVPARLFDWWNETETWAAELNVPPDEISATFKQKPKGLISNNSYNLTRYRTRFVKQVDANNVEGFDLTCLSSDWRYKALDWDFLGLYGRDRSAVARFVAGINMERLGQLPSVSGFIFAQEATCRGRSYLSVKYGFAVIMPRKFMPGFYAAGVASGELPDDLSWDANAWGHYSNHIPWAKECDRTLRNVYGYNILNAKHLDISVGNQRLEDWILASVGRGRIEPLGEGLFLWTFQEGDDNETFLAWDYPPVVRVREELKKYDIFLWQKLMRQQQEPLKRDNRNDRK